MAANIGIATSANAGNKSIPDLGPSAIENKCCTGINKIPAEIVANIVRNGIERTVNVNAMAIAAGIDSR